MNKLTTAVLGLAVAALPVLAASPAFAQDERDCNRAQREVTRVELRLAATVTEERNAEQKLVDDARAALRGLLDDAIPNGEQRDAIDAARSLVDLRVRELNTDSRRLVDLRAELARVVQDRNEACDDDPTPTPTPTTPPATTPPADNDVDCTEVSDARAQEILNADKSDPNNLDEDNDGIACEDDVIVQRDVVRAPTGGVQTGGGPA